MGLGVFKIITDECVRAVSTWVIQRKESILRMCSKLSFNLKEKQSNHLSSSSSSLFSLDGDLDMRHALFCVDKCITSPIIL